MTQARAIQKPTANPSTGDAFLDAESSIQDSEPRELIEITHGTTTHRIATATRDIVHVGNLYVAIPSARGEIGLVGTGNPEKEMTVTLPIDHPSVRRWLALGSPPKTMTVKLIRLQGALVRQEWIGEVTALSCNDEGTEAVFRVPSRLGRSLLKVIPAITAGRTCRHLLFDGMCQIARTINVTYYSTTVDHVNGREVRVSLGVPVNNAFRSDWAVAGELKHVASGEIMGIFDQKDTNPGFSTITVLTLQAPIPGLKVGDTVEVVAGCKRDMATCHGKFANRHRFGAFNRMPSRNVWAPQNNGPDETGEMQ